MKNKIKVLGFICCIVVFTQYATAQIEKGKILLGGSSDLGFTSSSSSAGGANTGALDVNLSVGYLITNGLAFGLDISYVSVKNTVTISSVGGGMFIRYYIKCFYPEFRAGITVSDNGMIDFRSTYVGGGIGYAIMLNDFVSLDPKINFTKTTYDGGDSSDFGLRIALNIYL